MVQEKAGKIQKICNACTELGTEKPRYELVGNGMRVHFAALDDALFEDAQEENSKPPKNTTEITSQKTTQKTTQKILDCIRQNPYISRTMLAELCNITSDGIKWQLKSLQDKGILRRIGPDKGGHWEINEPSNVIPNRQNDISVDVLDGGLAERILEELNYNPMITQVYLAQKLDLPVRTLQREMNSLAAAGIIVRVGGKRFGHWKVNK